MAAPVLIDLSNYDTMLVESTASRSGSPDGNIYFGTATGKVELITFEQLASCNLGSGMEANPLTDATGITIGALYAFERLRRRNNETLRQYDFFAKGTFKYAGAYELVNGRKFSVTPSDDRPKVRASGWIERAASGSADRIYFGARSLGNVESSSQPYYQLSAGGAPEDFAKAGPVDEAIQVFGTTSWGDTGAGDFSSLTYLSNKIRTFGYNYDEKTLPDSGISEMSGFTAGFALGESPHLTSGAYAIGDVYGSSQISPWIGMSLEMLASSSTQTGFQEGAGDFTWFLNNSSSGTLNQCVAFLDALAQTDNDIDSGTETVTNGKRVSTWYTYDAQGRIVTRSGAGDGMGLFVENVPISDQQRVVFTSDSGSRTYPFWIEVNVNVGAAAAADANAWYHVYEATDYGSSSAVTLLDASDAEVKGSVASQSTITFSYDSADGAQSIVVEVEGDGGATAAKTTVAIDAVASVVNITCAPTAETNT